MSRLTEVLPHVNAALNLSSALALALGFALIRKGNYKAHAVCMVVALIDSTFFLGFYLLHHYLAGVVYYHGPWRLFYRSLLASHTVLAAAVPPLALRTAWQARRGLASGDFSAHRGIARITFPIWMYVSVTGVVVYAMLYR